MQRIGVGTMGEVHIVLVETSHPGNIGAAARAMKVMGLERLVLVAPRCEPDAQARARASGAADIVRAARIVSTLDAALAGVRFVAGTSARAQRRLGPILTDVRRGALELATETVAGDTAVLFGPERTGLDNAALDLCNRLWRIPTARGYASLNLAAAVQVVAYEIHVAAVPGAQARLPPAAPAEDVARLCQHFDRVARRIGYIAPDAPRLALRRMQRLARRARLEPAEVKLLRGFLGAAEGGGGRRLRPAKTEDEY